LVDRRPEIDASSRNTGFIKRSVEWIVSRFEVDKNSEIADFGCGPGLYTNLLAERGAMVTGIDFSENSLKYAKQTAAENRSVTKAGRIQLAAVFQHRLD
jgi:2-polyprenyl-3-methyl-5-hydroxy-6-metoxy-1,4-benzoquinol methylase